MTRRRPLGARAAAQLEIPMAPQLREPETAATYRAVTRLRQARLRVYRAGRDHLVAGSLVTTRELFRLERAVMAQSPRLADMA